MSIFASDNYLVMLVMMASSMSGVAVDHCRTIVEIRLIMGVVPLENPNLGARELYVHQTKLIVVSLRFTEGEISETQGSPYLRKFGQHARSYFHVRRRIFHELTALCCFPLLRCVSLSLFFLAADLMPFEGKERTGVCWRLELPSTGFFETEVE